MVCLPFIAGAMAAGDWFRLRTLAAALAMLSIFLLRTPLLTLYRTAAAAPRPGATAPGSHSSYQHDALVSLGVYGSIALVSALFLSWTLPAVPLALLGGGAFAMTAATLYLTLRNRQRSFLFQLASVPGLTAASLLGYLAAAGELHPTAFWVWILFTAQMSVSVVVVRAQLEFVVATNKRSPNPPVLVYRRRAVLTEASLWSALALAALQGQPWAALAFLPSSLLHGWSLWRLGSPPARLSMRRVGIAELTASLTFSFLLITFVLGSTR